MNFKLSFKLPMVIVGLALLGLGITAFTAIISSEDALETAQAQKLEAVQEARIDQLESYLASIREDMLAISANHSTNLAVVELEQGFDELGANAKGLLQTDYITSSPHPVGQKHLLDAADTSTHYNEVHRELHPWFRKFLELRGYYDVFLINAHGDVVYSVYKELDFATNVVTGEWKDSGLAQVFQDVKANAKTDPEHISMTDFAPYGPSANAPASFIGAPMFDDDGHFHAALIFQMPIERINSVMQSAAGMGETGESYLVGPDMLMRSDSRFEKESTILKRRVDSEQVKKSFAGEDGTMVGIDYRGVEVIAAYGPLKFNGITWAVIAEIDLEEVDIPIVEMRNGVLIEAVIIAIVIAAVGIFFALAITRPISAVTEGMSALANGQTDVELPTRRAKDELGDMIVALGALKETVVKAFQLQQMIEDMPINVMTANKDTMVIDYANKASIDTLRGLEEHLPIQAKDLVGTCIDVFHKNPAHQRQLLGNPSNLPHSTRINVGPETLSLSVAAIQDPKGNYVGPMLTWSVITQQVKIADDFEANVGHVVESVASAATEMQSSAEALSGTADQTSQESTAVAAAAEEASSNVQTVASAAEELSSSISEISRQVSQSTQIAGAAVAEVDGANAKVQGLADAANKIGEVVALITDIADQTNLLALNATIEAARAGEAGKGFAVVASEVKNLANQTAKATEEIATQIGGIQNATQDAVQAIGSIGGTINQMSEIASTIAAAVEEQGAATQEIARNVEQAAAGTGDVTSKITNVNANAAETGQSANQVLEAARDLSKQSETLRGQVDSFLVEVRAT